MKNLKTFECRIENFDRSGDFVKSIIALTRSKARYQFWKDEQEVLNDWEYVLKHIKVRSLGKFSIDHLYSKDSEGFERVCKSRGIEFAYIGMEIKHKDKKGVIVGHNHCSNLDIVFEGDTYSQNCHPRYEMSYYHNNVMVKYFEG